MIFFKSFFQNVDQFSPYLTSKYISKSNFVLHFGKFYKKNHFFGLRFSKFHRHVIHFLCKKRAKKRLLIVIFIKKISRKNEKTRRICQIVPTCDTKKQCFQEIFTYGWSWEKWYNVLKNVISDVLQTSLSLSKTGGNNSAYQSIFHFQCRQ